MCFVIHSDKKQHYFYTGGYLFHAAYICKKKFQDDGIEFSEWSLIRFQYGKKFVEYYEKKNCINENYFHRLSVRSNKEIMICAKIVQHP